ncbi:transglutaminase domain-containing protein [Candidatus Woesearchaeota archaeon]|nr:transglutaminase domain-containing protein [Candidatus Woesearchaeota archaeon]
MQKEVFVIVLILLSLSASATLTPDNIYLSSLLKIQTNMTSDFTITSSDDKMNIDYVKATVSFFPRQNHRQIIERMAITPPATVTQNYVEFLWNQPKQQKTNYKIDSTITTKNEFATVKQKIQYPIEIPQDIKKYLEPTKNIDSEHPDIVRKANELAQGHDDLFILVSTIALWVKNNINYSLSTMTAEVSQPASWVLKNKIGVCDELTSLFAAMLRSLGIPAKFVSGLAYSNSPQTPEDWGPHGWAEVYFPTIGWVPFDPTFGEFGWIDPAHIKMKESTDPVDPSTRYEWRGRNIDVKISQPTFKTNVINFGTKINPLITIKAKILKETVGFGSTNLVEATVENLKDYYVTTEIILARVPELEFLDELAKQIILRPKEKQKLFWRVSVKQDLNQKYLYTFPIVLYTIRNETFATEFSATSKEPRYTADDILPLITAQPQKPSAIIKLTCTPETTTVLQNMPLKILCTATNKQNKETTIDICISKNCKKLALMPALLQTATFDAKTTTIGIHDVLITATADDTQYSTRTRYTVADVPQIQITNLTFPQEITFEQKKRMKFTLTKESWAQPRNVLVSIQSQRQAQNVKFETIEGDIPFIFVIEGKQLNTGDNRIPITITYEDSFGNTYTTKSTANIALVNTTIMQKISIFLRKIRIF